MSVRVRFAPSPTGLLHPGGARTVLFNYLFARQNQGSFLLRIEDTDRGRYDEASLTSITEGLRWLGLEWDEGPGVGGGHFPYFQSERLAHYHAAAARLLEGGHAYRCFCTSARLEALRESQRADGRPTRYDRHCAAIPDDESESRFAAGELFVVRMRVPPGTTTTHDLLRGTSAIDNGSQDDQVLLKSDGFPTYHLASVVDDHLMEITHVIRADEWLGSFAKHLMLYSMLGYEPPLYAHLPLVLGPDKTKLSKRHGATSVLENRDLGYLPEAMLNFLALLGWSPGTDDDFLDLERLVASFDLSRVQVSPAVFDRDKLDSLNGRHIRALDPAEFARRLAPFVPELSPPMLELAAPLVQERMQRLTEGPDLLNFFVLRPVELPADLVPKNRDAAGTIPVLQEARAFFENGELGPGQEEGLRQLAEGAGWKAGELFMTLRIALTGSRVTPPLLESARLLGRSECLVRLDHAIGQLICLKRD
ncbi:MAG: glutamate--tRNA ligase [Candidatus Dormibacteria bacterium]